MNPACDREVNRGPLASGLSGGTRLAIGFITDGEYVPDAVDVWKNIWETANVPEFAGYLDIDNLHMAMAIAAVGDGWGATTSEDLATLGEGPDWPVYTLLHRALHGDAALGWCRSAAATNTRARVMLDELPIGAEPASPQPAGPAVHGFTRTNRFMRGKEQAYPGEDGSEGYRFNGLDYLLLHNLYALATPSTWEGGSGPGIPECVDPPPDDDGATAAGTGDPGETSADERGCGCRAAGRTAHLGGAAWLLLLGAAVLSRRVAVSPRERPAWRRRCKATRPPRA